MLHIPPSTGQLSYGQTELIHTIRRCGLTSGLKLCLDAGDANSYSSGQSWLDRSGNGYDFFRGATVGAEASDPTFNGTAGRRSSGEYWSFDGGDYFRYDTTNEAWMQNLHKNNAALTLFMAIYLGTISGAGNNIFGTEGANVPTSNTGVAFRIHSASQLQFFCGNAGASVIDKYSGWTVSSGVWHFIGFSADEAANTSLFFSDGTVASGDFTYTSPATGNASYTTEVGCGGNALDPLPSTSRLGMFAAWEGVALTQTQLHALYMQTRGRFGV